MSQECLWGNLLHQGGGWVSTDHTATVIIPRDLKGARAERGKLEEAGGPGFASSRPSTLSSVLVPLCLIVLTFSLLCQLFCAHLGY